MSEEVYLLNKPKIILNKKEEFKELIKRTRLRVQEERDMCENYDENDTDLIIRDLSVDENDAIEADNGYYHIELSTIINIFKEFIQNGEYLLLEINNYTSIVYFFDRKCYKLGDISRNADNIIDKLLSTKEPNFLDYSESRKEQLRSYFLYGFKTIDPIVDNFQFNNMQR